MAKKFQFLEDIAIADVAFESFGKNLNELFGNSALALAEILADSKKIRPVQKKEIELKAKTIESLLYDFLSELLYLKDVEGIVYNKAKTKISKKEKEFVLKAKIFCQPISRVSKQFLKNDAKAITMHQFSAKKTNGKWIARIIVDI